MPPLISFSTITNILILVKRINFTLVFFKAACHANSGAKINFAASSLYILRHQLEIVYRFEHTSHEILLNFLFRILYKLFLLARNLHE